MPETAEKVIEVTPYRAEDARTIRLTPRAEESLRHLGNLGDQWTQYERMGPAWTLRVDGQIVGCAGLIFMWPKPTPKVAHAWLLPSPTMHQYPRTVVEAIVTRLRELIDEYGLVRVQLEVQADFMIGHRFVQWLGFTREQDGVARRYGPANEDFVRYELVRPL
jgi:RimJ/RimL family protein N-acetyltransferase